MDDAFERLAIDLLEACRSLSQACELLGLDWRSVHRIMEPAVQRGLDARQLEGLRRVGLDEKSFGLGQDYVSVLSDLDQRQIQECDLCVHRQLAQMDSRAPLPKPAVTLKAQLHRVCGVDLTKIPGIKEQAAQVIISEVGLDMTKWNTEKQFSSFLGLCPDNSISGGKVLR